MPLKFLYICFALHDLKFQAGIFILSTLTPNCVVIRKGPIERVSFPAATANVSPFQYVATYIMILGQKIDSAQSFKAGLSVVVIVVKKFVCIHC